jgi:hypothetical protein
MAQHEPMGVMQSFSSLLPRFLTLDAIPCPWDCVQPFPFDLTSAMGAFTEGALLYSPQSVLKPSYRLPCNVRFVRKRLSFVLSRSLISRIRVPRGTRSRLLIRVCEDALRFCNLRF